MGSAWVGSPEHKQLLCRFFLDSHVPFEPADLDDPVPDAVRTARGLVPFGEALRLVHRPASDADWKRGQDALRFQEAFVLQAGLLRQRAERRSAGTPVRTPGRLSSTPSRSTATRCS